MKRKLINITLCYGIYNSQIYEYPTFDAQHLRLSNLNNETIKYINELILKIFSTVERLYLSAENNFSIDINLVDKKFLEGIKYKKIFNLKNLKITKESDSLKDDNKTYEKVNNITELTDERKNFVY
jgi:hypothetical protein